VSRDAIDYRGALEAVERILNRGGDAEDVLRGVLEALAARGISFARIQLTGGDGLKVGERRQSIAAPVAYEGSEIGSLELATDDRALAERVAMLISHEAGRLGTDGDPIRLPPERSDGSNWSRGKCGALFAAKALACDADLEDVPASPGRLSDTGSYALPARSFENGSGSAPGARCRPRSGGRHSSCADLSPLML
jgi:hypothetical protein